MHRWAPSSRYGILCYLVSPRLSFFERFQSTNILHDNASTSLSSSSIPYSVPDLPPESLSELITRLTALESALGQLSSLSQSDRSIYQQERSRITRVVERVADLEDSTTSDRSDGVKLSNAVKKEIDEREKYITGVKKDLESLGSRLKYLSDERKLDGADIKRLKSGMDSAGKEIVTLRTNIAQVAKDVTLGADADRLVKIALASIESRLPSKLAVRMDAKTGELEIDPTFWKYLKLAFAEKHDLNSIIDERISNTAASTSTSLIPAKLSWDDFLVSNEVALRSWIDSDIEGRIGSEAIVSKRAFLDILRREIKTLKKDFEIKANENVQKIGEELLNKVARQQQVKKASSHNPLTRPEDYVTNTQGQITINSDGQNITAIISQLVDSALLRYSKDVLARPDYALFSSGGRVIPSLTSPTYSIQSTASNSKLYSLFFGSSSIIGRPPVTALHPDNSLGSCWSFSGSYGQLGILLSRRVIPSDISIEHASIEVALDGELSSAPKEFELWGVVEDVDDLKRLAEYRDQIVLAGSEEDLIASMPDTPNHILLASGSYDIASSSTPIQSFPVTTAARALGIPVGVVVLKILSNHGEARYTCLYRVRISGATIAAATF